MPAAKAAGRSIKPEVRREVEAQVVLLNALTFSATVVQAEAQALRNAVVTALRAITGSNA